jgi:hypothetical protein
VGSLFSLAFKNKFVSATSCRLWKKTISPVSKSAPVGAPLVALDSKKVMGAISLDFSPFQFSFNEIEKLYKKLIVSLGNDIPRMMPSV